MSGWRGGLTRLPLLAIAGPMLAIGLQRSGIFGKIQDFIFPHALHAFEANKLPDTLTRLGIRTLCAQRLQQITYTTNEAQQQSHQAFVDQTKTLPIAINTPEANEQHYEVDARFYHRVLGPNRKYSCALYSPMPKTPKEAAEKLGEAEINMFKAYALRNNLDGSPMRILDLGCGWGSLSLWLAKTYPNSQIVGVSNSNSQREYIHKLAARRGLTNVHIYTGDINDFDFPPEAQVKEKPFDRAFSIEMFEHMKNYEKLLAKISAWLKPQASLFVHIFTHKSIPYHFEVKGEDDWMSKFFFTGGTMPSSQLLLHYQNNLRIDKQWHVNGAHYGWTSEAWLYNMDKKEQELMPILEKAYGKGKQNLWFVRWRAFFMACAELFFYNRGNEWFVAHYRFVKP
eukprot:gb/GEZN01007410.1/.p1 GENE.gb/GEZN01007410.1/~~gb/GEZN01007410.1/.p1  ORF type:complete len:397 (-),score=47.92 gb/GEZN01007410.1/:242-1432(-)